MQLIPRKIKPSTTSTALTIHINEPTSNCGKTAASRMDRPDVPPNAKWFGVLNSTIPIAVSISPMLSRPKNFRLFSRFSVLNDCFNASIAALPYFQSEIQTYTMQKYTPAVRVCQGVRQFFLNTPAIKVFYCAHAVFSAQPAAPVKSCLKPRHLLPVFCCAAHNKV